MCEPQLGKRGLYPTLSKRGTVDTQIRRMMNMLAYTDGEKSLLEIARIIGADIFECAEIASKLEAAGVIHLKQNIPA